ncbi:MAG: hypothetical protein EOM21_20100 [Gammaproteobacteria bacterium]|nr:hypothetical protein [Gammaproteobacteria bacterium]
MTEGLLNRVREALSYFARDEIEAMLAENKRLRADMNLILENAEASSSTYKERIAVIHEVAARSIGEKK